MTRDSDRFVSLSSRASTANRLSADLFVSVHVNANRSRWVSGAEVYYPRVSVVSSDAKWPPNIVSSEIGVASAVIKQILWDLVLRRSRSRSHRLASNICGSVKDSLEVRCKVKSARFVVLREARMPSVLVEVGYVTNEAESKRLRNASYREAAARSIARGIVSYVRGLEAQHI